MKLIDPRLRTAIPDHWSSLCSIVSTTYTTTGAQKVPTGTATVTGMSNLQCRLAPLILLRPTNTEKRDDKTISTNNTLHCLLNGYYTSIVPRVHQALVDGVAYDIRGVEHDSERFLTRLRMERLEP